MKCRLNNFSMGYTLFYVQLVFHETWQLVKILEQGCNAWKVNCGCVYSAYILKAVHSGRNLQTKIVASVQSNNARKVISMVYAFFVPKGTVFGRKSKQKTDVTAWRGIHFHKNNLCIILLIGNYYVNTEASFLVYKVRQERENWFQYVRRVYATAINFPCITLQQWR